MIEIDWGGELKSIFYWDLYPMYKKTDNDDKKEINDNT